MNKKKEYAVRVTTREESSKVQRKLGKLGYSWTASKLTEFHPQDEYWMVIEPSTGNLTWTGNLANSQDFHAETTVIKEIKIKDIKKKVPKAGEPKSMIPTQDIHIATHGQYKLYTDKKGRYYSAGCAKDLTCEAALKRWYKGRDERGTVFHQAITDYRNMVKCPEETLKALQALREQAEQAPEKKSTREPWRPKSGDSYFYVGDTSEVKEAVYRDVGFKDTNNEKRIASGNVYKTREAAQRVLDRQIAVREVNAIIREVNAEEGWTEPEYNCNGATKGEDVGVAVYTENETAKYFGYNDYRWNIPSEILRFKACPNTITKIRDRITAEQVKLIFNIEEGE